MCSIVTILIEEQKKFEKTFADVHGKGQGRLGKGKCCNSISLYL